MTNEYGLDVSYFKDKLSIVIRDLNCTTPAEMKRMLEVLVNVVEKNIPQVKTNKYPACLLGEPLEQLDFPVEFLNMGKKK